jgi:hypothetical protein
MFGDNDGSTVNPAQRAPEGRTAGGASASSLLRTTNRRDMKFPIPL